MRQSRPALRRVAAVTTAALAVGITPFVAAAPASAAAPTELFISEYVEGSSNNKALEIYNGTGATVDLAAAGYNVQVFANGATTAASTINLTGTVASGDVFVFANTVGRRRDPRPRPTRRAGAPTGTATTPSCCARAPTVLDVIGQVGVDPGTEWGTGLTSTADNTLRRKSSVTAGDTERRRRLRPRRPVGRLRRRHLRRARQPHRRRRPGDGRRPERHLDHPGRRRLERRGRREPDRHLLRAGRRRSRRVHALVLDLAAPRPSRSPAARRRSRSTRPPTSPSATRAP